MHTPRSGMKRIAVAGATTAMLASVGVVATATTASAHGAPIDPASRTYTCRFLTPDNEMCKQAWNANSQALYDWNEVNIGSAAGQHQALIPDGQLCSAGRDKYAAFNTASDKWPTTNLTPDADGKYTLKWQATAPHATSYFRVYVTKPSFNVNAAPLKWSDLDLAYDSGQSGPEAWPVLRTSLPQRTNHSILYTVWQRSDSTEAFYACNDVTINAGKASPSPSPTSASPTPTVTPTTASPTPTPAPTTPSPTAGVSISLKKTDEWGSGRNYDATVTNNSGVASSSWQVTLPWTSAVEPWNASATAAGGLVTFSNASWNGDVANGATANFGFTDRGYVPPNPQSCTAKLNSVPVACSVVGASGIPSPTPTTPTPTPTPTTASPTPTPTLTTASPTPTPTVITPTPTPTSGGAVKTAIKVTTDWGVGYCADVTISSTSSTPVKWSVKVPVAKGKVTTVWEANYSISGKTISATGKPWNNTVKAGQSRTFGFCAG